MGICARELAEYVIRPTLKYLGSWSEETERLLARTAAVQSGMGRHIGETSAGRGIYAIDSETHQRVWDEFLAFRPDLASRVRGLASQREFLVHPDLELSTNLAYATAIAWTLYLWAGTKLPLYGKAAEPVSIRAGWFPPTVNIPPGTFPPDSSESPGHRQVA